MNTPIKDHSANFGIAYYLRLLKREEFLQSFEFKIISDAENKTSYIFGFNFYKNCNFVTLPYT